MSSVSWHTSVITSMIHSKTTKQNPAVVGLSGCPLMPRKTTGFFLSCGKTGEARTSQGEVGRCLHLLRAWGSLSRHDILAQECTVGCRLKVLYKLLSPMRWGIVEDSALGSGNIVPFLFWQEKIQGWGVLDLSVKYMCCPCVSIITFGFNSIFLPKKYPFFCFFRRSSSACTNESANNLLFLIIG